MPMEDHMNDTLAPAPVAEPALAESLSEQSPSKSDNSPQQKTWEDHWIPESGWMMPDDDQT